MTTYSNFYSKVFVPFQRRTTWEKFSGNGGSQAGSPGPCRLEEHRHLGNNPDWRVQVLKSENATTLYTRRIIDFKPRSTLVTTQELIPGNSEKVSSVSRIRFANDPSDFVLENEEDTALRDLALKRLKQKLSSRSNQMNLLVPAAEIRELRGSIRAIAYAGIDVLKALIEIKKTKGKSAFQYASHAWLQFSFAISPTVGEVSDICGSIDDYLNDASGGRYTDYGAARKEWNTSAQTSVISAYGGNSPVKMQMRHKLSYRYTAGYKLPFRSSNDYSVGKRYGLEPGALVPTLWELTPFSWLYDYFTTMGDYLEDTFITDLAQPIYVVLTKKYTCHGAYNVLPAVGSWVKSSYIEGEQSSFDWTFVKRSSSGLTVPQRQLRFKTSDEISKNAVNKLLNLSSILVGGKAFSNRIK